MDQADNPARLSGGATRSLRSLKPLGFRNTTTLCEIPEKQIEKDKGANLVEELIIKDLDNNYLKLLISEDFYKFGGARIEIKVDNYFINGVIWLFRGELLEFKRQIEAMYRDLKGIAILMDSESALEAEFSFDIRGYVNIKGRFKERYERENQLLFSLKTTQPEIQELMNQIDELFKGR
ncbi:hypothetical protein [Gorillibacterium massiliense]|uniref:WapI family immunity protein n=1 Tax=Gorillibacterium massiliense TaxID=1280390 RepID=UPI0012DEFF8A|nr:hypothetical protein [Gorillibacterium massiliense]